jgi:tetratricopeptide (TPR) repeat protein
LSASNKRKTTALALALALALAAIIIFSGCSIPRIIVLQDPLIPEEHINLGLSYEEKGEMGPAIKEYRTAAKKTPAAYLYLGNAYFKLGDEREAERWYKKAIKAKGPQTADARNNLAWLYYTEKQNLDRAEEMAQEAMELNPAKADLYADTLKKIRQLKLELGH